MAPPVNMSMDWRDQNTVKKDGQWTVDGRPVIAATVSYHQTPPNIPGKAFIGLKVTVPINGATPPHKHGGAAVAATVVQGRVLNQMICPDGHVEGPNIYEKGDSWYEMPGCHHVRSENVGDEEAVFVANFVTDQKAIEEKGVLAALVQIDAEEQEDAHKEKK